jgi:hypothetical protein
MFRPLADFRHEDWCCWGGLNCRQRHPEWLISAISYRFIRAALYLIDVP